MKQRAILPTRAAAAAVSALAAAAAAALLAGVPLGLVVQASTVALVLLLAWAGIDLVRSRRAWAASPVHVQRQAPPAFALGVPTQVTLVLENAGR